MKADVAVGFAADEQGNGVAYVRLGSGAERARIMRIAFTVKRYPALLDREVGYAALTAASNALRARGVRRVRLTVDDPRLAAEVREHRDVPAPLAMAYVRLGCALNQFAEYEIAELAQGESDLRSRALAEVAVHAAA
jgi:hypothetical protein